MNRIDEVLEEFEEFITNITINNNNVERVRAFVIRSIDFVNTIEKVVKELSFTDNNNNGSNNNNNNNREVERKEEVEKIYKLIVKGEEFVVEIGQRCSDNERVLVQLHNLLYLFDKTKSKLLSLSPLLLPSSLFQSTLTSDPSLIDNEMVFNNKGDNNNNNIEIDLSSCSHNNINKRDDIISPDNEHRNNRIISLINNNNNNNNYLNNNVKGEEEKKEEEKNEMKWERVKLNKHRPPSFSLLAKPFSSSAPIQSSFPPSLSSSPSSSSSSPIPTSLPSSSSSSFPPSSSLFSSSLP